MTSIPAYGAEQYTIAVRGYGMHKAVFQIHCRAKDGSIFVAFPYAEMGAGRVGICHIPIGNPSTLSFGASAPVTTHAVKYVHHASGQAHFSQDGKVFTRIKRQSVSLQAADGHLFTVQLQGLDRFKDVRPNAPVKKGVCVVTLPLQESSLEGLKFVVQLYPAISLARHLKLAASIPHLLVHLGDGRRLPGVILATKVFRGGVPHLLMVSVEHVPLVRRDQHVALTLMGGFDPPEQALDHSKPTSWLMMLYPQTGDLNDLARSFGTIDLPCSHPQYGGKRP